MRGENSGSDRVRQGAPHALQAQHSSLSQEHIVTVALPVIQSANVSVKPKALLTYGNLKTEKSVTLGWLTAIMHFAPANLSGYEVCNGRTRGCTAVCLNSAGHGGIGATFDERGNLTKANTVQSARIARTRFFFEHRDAFFAMLVSELQRHVRKAARMGLKPAVRLNGTSDILWEDERMANGLTIFETFPEVRFYDYTKRADRLFKTLPENYSLTFSRAETTKSALDAMRVLQSGGNVAAVFAKHLPEMWNGYRVIDGVSHDLRFLDERNVIVGLVAKGKARADKTSGFVIQH
jgi:hypothetical protein